MLRVGPRVDTVGLVKREMRSADADVLLVDAADATDVSLCSGKAVELATLQRADAVLVEHRAARHDQPAIAPARRPEIRKDPALSDVC